MSVRGIYMVAEIKSDPPFLSFDIKVKTYIRYRLIVRVKMIKWRPLYTLVPLSNSKNNMLIANWRCCFQALQEKFLRRQALVQLRDQMNDQVHHQHPLNSIIFERVQVTPCNISSCKLENLLTVSLFCVLFFKEKQAIENLPNRHREAFHKLCENNQNLESQKDE